MEGTGRDIPLEFAERLHRGDFSIQTHIDLHGLGVAEAKDVFENFLNDAIRLGKRAVLIIHGRGISSPGEPVLKNKVSDWLTRSHWRKWVVAFTSAQSYDGGAGATYVLLRHRLKSKEKAEGNMRENRFFCHPFPLVTCQVTGQLRDIYFFSARLYAEKRRCLKGFFTSIGQILRQYSYHLCFRQYAYEL